MNRIIAGPLMGLLAIFCLIFSSCQKELDIDLDNPPTLPEEIEDSTFLIKSIAWMYNDGKDSVVEHYAYDTANRKITLTWTDSGIDPNDPGPHEFKGAKTELSYNNAGLLISVDYTHSPTLPPSDEAYKKMEISYDNENILQKITLNYRNLPPDTRDFEKKLLQDGRYSLFWIEPAIAVGDRTTYRSTVFTPEGKAQVNAREMRLGVSLVGRKTWIDSLAYDGSGNVEQVFTWEYDEGNLSEEYISAEYSGRESKGDQIYNQPKLILRGISEITLGVLEEMILGSGGIFSGFLEFEPTQFTRFPAKRAVIRLYDGSFRELQPIYSLDNKDRLTRFTLYYFTGIDIIPNEYRISYFN